MPDLTSATTASARATRANTRMLPRLRSRRSNWRSRRPASSALLGSLAGNWIWPLSVMESKVVSPDVKDSSILVSPMVPKKRKV
jgi:hypothetical protein